MIFENSFVRVLNQNIDSMKVEMIQKVGAINKVVAELKQDLLGQFEALDKLKSSGASKELVKEVKDEIKFLKSNISGLEMKKFVIEVAIEDEAELN